MRNIPFGYDELVDMLLDEADAVLEERAADVLRGPRHRLKLIRERERIRDALREVARKRHALERLRESEVRAAERLRRRHAREARPIQQVVVEAMKHFGEEARRLRGALQRCEAALAATPPAYGEDGAAFLRDLRALAPLLAERVALEYRRLDREMLRDYRSLTVGGRPHTEDARRFLERLAFLMAKANFDRLSQKDLERGFEIGPAPGVRLAVPLGRFQEAHFFARGKKLEPHPSAEGGIAPRYEKFAFCLLERPRRARARRRSRALRRLGVLVERRVKPYLAPRVDYIADYVRKIARTAPPDVAVDPPLAIKLFRDVGLGESGLVLPGAAIRYRVRDLALVFWGAIGSIFSKIAEKPLAALFAPKLFFSLFAMSAFRGLLGMRRSRVTLDKLREEYENRHLQATRMNAVEYFLREAAEMDAKEILLAYFFAALGEGERTAIAGLQARIENFFRTRLRASIEFDMEDALGGLEAFRLTAAPVFLAPGETADYFDPRLVGEAYRHDAEALLESRAAEPAPHASRVPAEASFVAPAEALWRVRADLRLRLGLEDFAPPRADIAAEPTFVFGERFTL